MLSYVLGFVMTGLISSTSLSLVWRQLPDYNKHDVNLKIKILFRDIGFCRNCHMLDCLLRQAAESSWVS